MVLRCTLSAAWLRYTRVGQCGQGNEAVESLNDGFPPQIPVGVFDCGSNRVLDAM